MALIKSGKEFDKDENHVKLAKLAAVNQQYTLRIPEHLYKQVKRKMVEDERTLRDILIVALNKYLNE